MGVGVIGDWVVADGVAGDWVAGDWVIGDWVIVGVIEIGVVGVDSWPVGVGGTAVGWVVAVGWVWVQAARNRINMSRGWRFIWKVF